MNETECKDYCESYYDDNHNCRETTIKVAENASDIVKIVGLILLGVLNIFSFIFGVLGKICHTRFCERRKKKIKKKIGMKVSTSVSSSSEEKSDDEEKSEDSESV